MINIENLSFLYGKHQIVFDRLNMELKAGYIYGLLGENGVGKTTFLRLLAGLRYPTRGSIEVMGFEPRRREQAFLKDLYYLPEVIDVVDLDMNRYAKMYAPFYPNFSYEQFTQYMGKWDIDPTRKLSKSSHGQQKKAMMSFALACNTRLLLLDEPTNGMDIPSKSIFRNLVASASSDEKCFVISTHQVRDLENLIDPIVILEKNQVLLNNFVDDITEKLWFGVRAEKSDKDLYREECVGGYNVVTYNDRHLGSRVNVEALFNAAIQNKSLFKRMFIDETEPGAVREDFAMEMERKFGIGNRE